ncbi:MAG TPA: patatin-like phospholipase family protein [Methylocystis sp.]|nr:patatin-like phospholipase family protein [Methylocystis sp.]
MFSLMLKSFDMSSERGLAASPSPPANASADAERRSLRPKIGLALGAGAARGWAHIGVLREFAEHGIQPDVIAGTSIGAVVGGCYAAGKLDAVEKFARSLTKRRVFAMLDLSFSGSSLITGERLRAALEQELKGYRIEDLPIPFAAVATEVGAGHEIWLQRGPLDIAIRASYALPGIFEPVKIGQRYLFDGALVNPVPVTVCHALGAEFVIAVNVAADMMYRSSVLQNQSALSSEVETAVRATVAKTPTTNPLEFMGDWSSLFGRSLERKPSEAPNVASAMIDAFNIIQDRILRSRLAGDPPDAIIHARANHIGMFDFHRADELIAIGREAAKRALPNIFAVAPASSDASA